MKSFNPLKAVIPLVVTASLLVLALVQNAAKATARALNDVLAAFFYRYCVLWVNHQSDYAKRIRPMPVASGSEVVSVRMQVPLPANHALNDILEFGELPEDHVPVDFILDATDIDTNGAPAVVLSAGLLNAGKTDISADAADGGAAWLTGSNIGQAGGMARPSTRAFLTTQPKAATRRMLGGKITTGAATPVAGTVSLTIQYRAAHYGA